MRLKWISRIVRPSATRPHYLELQHAVPKRQHFDEEKCTERKKRTGKCTYVGQLQGKCNSTQTTMLQMEIKEHLQTHRNRNYMLTFWGLTDGHATSLWQIPTQSGFKSGTWCKQHHTRTGIISLWRSLPATFGLPKRVVSSDKTAFSSSDINNCQHNAKFPPLWKWCFSPRWN